MVKVSKPAVRSCCHRLFFPTYLASRVSRSSTPCPASSSMYNSSLSHSGGHSGLPAGSPLHNTASAKKHKPRQPYSTEDKVKYLRLKLFLDDNRRGGATSTRRLAFLWYVRFFHTAVLYLRAVDVESKPTGKRHARLLLNTVAWISGRDRRLTLKNLWASCTGSSHATQCKYVTCFPGLYFFNLMRFLSKLDQ